MEKVSNIVHVVNLPHDILVSWDAVAGATSYTAELRSGNQTVESKSVAVPEVPFAALVIGQIYEILITATDGVETSEPARYVVYLSERDWLSPPPDLAYTELETGDGFTVTWGASPSALSYRMVVEPFGVQDPEEVFNGPATSPHVISGLPAEKLFRIYVYPVNGTEEGQPSTIVGWVQPDVGESRPTAHRLFPAEVQGSYYLLYQPYIENMRPLYSDERFWRLQDKISFVSGPRLVGSGYALEDYFWKARIESPEAILIERILAPGESQEAGMEITVPTSEEAINVSVGFDQSGSLLLCWQTAVSSYFRWFDNTVGGYVVTDLGPVTTPVVASTNSITPTPTDWSARIVAYVDTSVGAVMYRKQADRYSVEYSLGVLAETPLEILAVASDAYGGFTFSVAASSGDEVVVKGFTGFTTANVFEVGRASQVGKFSTSVSLSGEAVTVGTEYIPYTPLVLRTETPQDAVGLGYASADNGTLTLTEVAWFTQFTIDDTYRDVSGSETDQHAAYVDGDPATQLGYLSADVGVLNQIAKFIFSSSAHSEPTSTSVNYLSADAGTLVHEVDKYLFVEEAITEGAATLGYLSADAATLTLISG